MADVLFCPRGRVDAPLDSGILGRQTKGIPANWVQHIMSSHEVKAGNDVGNGIHAQVAKMERPRRIRKHGQDVYGLLAGSFGVAEAAKTVPGPDILPFYIDLRKTRGPAGRMPRLRSEDGSAERRGARQA